MDLANMRSLGVRSLLVTCRKCSAERVINVDRYHGGKTVPSFGARMVCRSCGTSAKVMPNWAERPQP